MGLRLIWATIRLYPRDAIAIAATLILLAAFFLLYGYFYHPSWYSRAFGPGWNCSYAGEGDPICVKESGTPSGTQ